MGRNSPGTARTWSSGTSNMEMTWVRPRMWRAGHGAPFSVVPARAAPERRSAPICGASFSAEKLSAGAPSLALQRDEKICGAVKSARAVARSSAAGPVCVRRNDRVN